MTAIPPIIVRVQHPVQAGLAPAIFWILSRILSLGFLLAILWAVPVVATESPANQTAWALGILAAGIGVVVQSRILGRVVRLRIPGAMRRYGVNEIARMNLVPIVAANLIEVGIVLFVLPHLLAHSDSFGILAAFLALLGGGMIALGVCDAVTEVWNRLPDWRRRIVWTLVRPLPLALVLAYSGLVLAPDPDSVAPTSISIGIALVSFGALIGQMSRNLGSGISTGLDGATEALTAHVKPAPTLRDRAHARALTSYVVWGVLGVLATLVAIAVASIRL